MSYRNPLAQEINDLLAPLIGDFMARSALVVNTESIGTTPEAILSEHLEPFSRELERALIVFVGSAKAREVAGAITSLRP